MKFAVWMMYPPPKKAGPYLPQIVEAESFEDAVEVYSRQINRSILTRDESDFVVCRADDIVRVSRRRVREFEMKIIPFYDPDDEDDC